MSLPAETEILIIGAGPAGLSLATSLASHAIPFVLIDRLEARQTTSRAAAVHARTLEVLDRPGIANALVEAGRKILSVMMLDRDRELLHVDFAGLRSRFPFILTLPQSETEAILTRRLEALGGGIERGQEAIALSQDADSVRLTVRGSPVAVRARYVVGADGYHSMVRQACGIAFAPGTYAQSFILSDVHMDWPLLPDAM